MTLPPERRLIELLTEHVEHRRNEAGLTSDCAIVPLGDHDLVLTIDQFAQRTHFPEGTPAVMAGQLATVATLSDLAAAGSDVLGVLVGYGLPPGFTEADAREIGRRVAEIVQAHDGEVLGGDTKPRERLALSIAAVGTTPRGQALTRSGAQPGDVLLASGPLGGAGAALSRVRSGLAPRNAEPLLAPEARVDAGRSLRDAGVACCIDLSDGLADGATAISRASEVRAVVEADAVPLHPWAEGEPEGLDWALSTGGDYELLASVPAGAVDRVEAAWTALELTPARVGRVEEGSGAVLVDADGTEHVLERGYEHRFG